MKPNETLWNTPLDNGRDDLNGHAGHNGKNHTGKHEHQFYLGDNHVATSSETPLRPDAFEIDDETKIELIEKKMGRAVLQLYSYRC